MAGTTNSLAYLLVVFSLAISSAESVTLQVHYPVEGFYSFVSLTCVGELGDQRPAVFLRNGSDLNNGSSELVSVMMETEDSISFFFNQTQEGEFSCRTALGEESSPEQLAGECRLRWQLLARVGIQVESHVSGV